MDKLRVSPSGRGVDKTAKNGLLDVKHSAGPGAADVSGALRQGRLPIGLAGGRTGDKPLKIGSLNLLALILFKIQNLF
jgi:hypothetical protein